MFGLSASELIVVLAVAVAAWYLWRRSRLARKGDGGGGGGRRDTGAVQETVQCPVCGSYVPEVRPRPCERADCPYRR